MRASFNCTVEFKPPSCDYGYTLSAPATVTCNEQGTWSGPSPHCDIVNCTDPGTVVHGIMIGGQVRKTPYFTPYLVPYLTPYLVPYLTPYLTPYFTPYFTPYLHTISRSMLLYMVFYAAFYTVFTRYFLPYFPPYLPPYFPLYFRSILWSILCSILCPISCSIFCSVTHFFLTLFTQPIPQAPYPYLTTLLIFCNTGYKVKGFNKISCLGNGDWDHLLPKCVKIGNDRGLREDVFRPLT